MTQSSQQNKQIDQGCHVGWESNMFKSDGCLLCLDVTLCHLIFSWKQQSLPLLALNNGLSGADVEHAVEHGHLQSIKHLEPNGLAYLL